MEKYYLKNGKEVKMGDILTKTSKLLDTVFGEISVVHHITLTEKNLLALIKEGIITMKSSTTVKDDRDITLELAPYIQKIADKLGWKLEKTVNILNKVDEVLPAAAFSMVLREIAIELDKKYEDHIENSPEIYVISLLDGRITKANKALIKNYRNFAAFRTIEDARIACRITRDIIKRLFGSGK